jgi:hypothetical protein
MAEPFAIKSAPPKPPVKVTTTRGLGGGWKRPAFG